MSNLTESYFAEDSMIRRIYSEKHVAGLLGMRALLVQGLHGLAYHGMAGSRFFDEPQRRAEQTQLVMETVYFGTKEEANAVTQNARRLHMHVRGTVHNHSGSIPDGTEYSALHQDAQRWVIAGVMDAALSVYQMLVAPLSRAECDQFVREYQTVAKLFGAQDKYLFHTYAELQQYMRDMYATIGRTDLPPVQRLELTEEARVKMLKLALEPDHWLVKMFQGQWQTMIVGVLPAETRRLFKLDWNTVDEIKFQKQVAMLKFSIAKTRLWTPCAMLSPLTWCNPAALAWMQYASKGPMFYRRQR